MCGGYGDFLAFSAIQSKMRLRGSPCVNTNHAVSVSPLSSQRRTPMAGVTLSIMVNTVTLCSRAAALAFSGERVSSLYNRVCFQSVHMYGPQRRIVFVMFGIGCIIFLLIWEHGNKISQLRVEVDALKSMPLSPSPLPMEPFKTICLPRESALKPSNCVLELKLDSPNTCKPFYMGTFEQMTVCTYNPKEDGHMSSPISRGLVPGMETHTYNVAKRHLKRDLPRKGYVIDVGCNIGLFSFLGLSLGYNVIAIDPVADHVDMLLRSAIINQKADHLTVFKNAVSNQCGEASLNLGRSSRNPGGTSISLRSGGTTRVITLNDLLPNNTLPIHLVKIDVEGQEPWVLMGASDLWKRKPEMVIMELFHKRVTDERCNLRKILREFIVVLGYKLQVFPRIKLKWRSENIINNANELDVFLEILQPNSEMDVVFIKK